MSFIYHLVFDDPLDGSSNIGVNITTGTILLFHWKHDRIFNGNNIVMKIV